MSALTIESLATAMRLDVPLEPETNALLTRLMGVGRAIVDLHAEQAPADVADEAIIRLAAYLYDQPETSPGTRYSMAWKNSGAASLLGPWIVRSASIISANGKLPDGEGRSAVGGIDADTIREIAGQIAREIVASWAQADDDSAIPEPKLANAPGGGGDGTDATARASIEVLRTEVSDNGDTLTAVQGEVAAGVHVKKVILGEDCGRGQKGGAFGGHF